MAAMLAVPSLALAEGQTGVYIAPRFSYGFTQMNGMKASGTHQYHPYDDFSAKIGNKTDNAFGGALAVGYDFQQRFRVPVRAELEYAVFSQVRGRRNALMRDLGGANKAFGNAEQKIQTQTLFVNVCYDFHNDTAFTPYLGGGVGLAFLRSKGSFAFDIYDANGKPAPNELADFSLGTKNRTNFAWNIGTGVAYNITNNATLDLGYRFAGLGRSETRRGAGWNTSEYHPAPDLVTAKAKSKNIYMHQVSIGLRYSF